MLILKISDENVFSTMRNLPYGQSLASFLTSESMEMALKCVEAVNEIKGNEVLEISPAQEDYLEDNHYKTRDMVGVYRLLWKIRGEFPPALALDDISIEKNAEKAKENGSVIQFKINEGLFKRAKKAASGLGIKFNATAFGQSFNGQSRKKSVFKRLEEAHLNGEEKIIFDTAEIATQTVRVYVSQLNSFYGKAYSVSVGKGETTVYFKEKSKADELYKKIEALQNEFMPAMGKNAFWEVFNRFEIANDWNETINEIESVKAEENPPIREVEGLKQYFMPELEVNPKEFVYSNDPIDEDDDF